MCNVTFEKRGLRPTSSGFLISYALLRFVIVYAQAQGNLIYDQQSSPNEAPAPGAGGTIQQGSPGIGQSFTPNLNSVGFIRLKVSDANLTNSLGVTLLINLRTNSIGGLVLNSTTPVTLPAGFAGTVDLFFATSVDVTSGATYFFQPVVVTGDLWNAEIGEYNYPGGMAFYQGFGLSGGDFWFREGIIVPEPSGRLLVLVGGAMWFYVKRIRKMRKSG